MQQQNLFGGSNSAASNRKALYTGLNVFEVLGINPMKEQIEEWTGNPYKLNVDYSIVRINDKQVRPLEIWLKSTDGYVVENLRFLIGTADDINQNGTVRYVNTVGEMCQGKVDPKENPNMAWFTSKPYRVAKQGEYELYNFMQKVMRYNSREENAAFMADAEKLGITVDNIYNNNIQGLIQFFDWIKENGNKVILLCAVRKSEKIADDSTKKVYENQTLVNNPEYFYQTSKNEVTGRAIAKMSEALEKGRRISNSLFTIHFQDFKEEDCLNKVPENVASPTGTGTVANWLKN